MKRIIETLLVLVLFVVLTYVGRSKLAVFYYNQGNNYFDANMFDKAEASFKRALKINPSIAVAHYMLANTYTSRRMFDQAISEYKRCLEIDPAYIQAYSMLARIYGNNQMYEEAIGLIKYAEKLSPNNHEIKKVSQELSLEYTLDSLDKGIDYFLEGDTQKAYELLNRAILEKPDFAYAHYTLGFLYFNDGNLDAAANKLYDALEQDIQFWPAHKLLGDIYFEKGLYDKAAYSYKEALKLHRNDSSLENDLGITLMNMERYGEAVTHLQEALRLDPGNIDIRYSLANTYRDNKMFDSAILEYNNILPRKIDYPNIYNDLGGCLGRLGKKKEALEAYQNEINYDRKKLMDNPKDVIALNSLAFALNETGESGEARAIIEKALVIRPEYRQAHITLARIFEKSGYSKEALEELATAKRLSPQANFIERDIASIKKDKAPAAEAVFFAPDTVFLKNGRQIKGRIKQEDKEKIVLEVKIGPTLGNLIFYRNSIEKIVAYSQGKI